MATIAVSMPQLPSYAHKRVSEPISPFLRTSHMNGNNTNHSLSSLSSESQRISANNVAGKM